MKRSPRSEHATQEVIHSQILHALRLDGMKLPSANTLTRSRWAESNWRARFERALVPLLRAKRLSEIVIHHTRTPVRRLARPIPGAPRCAIYVTRVMGPRERPFEGENAWTSIKPLLDALVLSGYLPGDTDAWLERHQATRRAENGERAPAIVVRIERR